MCDIWNGFLKEIRQDAIQKQTQTRIGDADIELLGRTIFYLIDFAKGVRNYGLLYLDEADSLLQECGETDSCVMEKVLDRAAKLIVDGYRKEHVAEILSNEYWLNPPQGWMATVAYIVIRGMLLLQEEENGRTIEQMAVSLIPGAYRPACMKVKKRYADEKGKKEGEEAKIYFETDFSRSDSLEVRECLDWLELQLAYMTDAEVQRWLREVDTNYLIPALLGMKKRTRQKIAKNMSSRLRNLIMEECYRISDVDVEAILDGATYVVEILKVLQATGEILDDEARLLYR